LRTSAGAEKPHAGVPGLPGHLLRGLGHVGQIPGQPYWLAARPSVVESMGPLRASWIVVVSGLLLASPACATAGPRDNLLGDTCGGSKLRLELGKPIDEVTGQGTLLVAVINSSPQSCRLKGYPVIELLDRRNQRLAFVYRNRGDMMLTDVAPRLVTIRPGMHAYFAINKYRCDLAGEVPVSRMRVRLPGLSSRLVLDLPQGTRFSGYCGPGDPGSIVHISPVAIVAATLHR
jgi:hypothetical protein